MSNNERQVLDNVNRCLIVTSTRLHELLGEMMPPAVTPLPVDRDPDPMLLSDRMPGAFSAVKKALDAVETAQRCISRALSN